MHKVTWIRLLDSGVYERGSYVFFVLKSVGSEQITKVLIIQPDLQLPLKSEKKFPLTLEETRYNS